MKIKTYIILVIFYGMCLHILQAQQMQTAHWFFGEYTGIDFSSVSPLTDTNGQIFTKEGCSSISDEYGNLLFYTDGRKVYDSTHNLMPNGTGLRGDLSSTSSSIILPKPDDCNLYYIFTIDVQDGEVPVFRPKRGIEYNIVDMSYNGGLGDVIQKNIEIPINGIQQGYEKLAAISNADRTGYWVLTHFEGNFYAFSITADGVNLTPVVSSTNISTQLAIGYLKGSPDGTKLALGMESSIENDTKGSLSIYDFNNATGVVDNELILSLPGDGKGFYGIEFSTNSQLLYTESISNPDTDNGFFQKELIQYDLTAISIINSKYVIKDYEGYEAALQRGLDGKIYVANPGTSYLDRIENPDIIYNVFTGESPVHTEDAVYLGGNISSIGLPTFLNHYFRIAISINDLSISEEQLYCSGETLDFDFCSQGGEIQSIHWDFGDGSASTEFYPQYGYNTTGVHTITLTLIVDGEQYVRTFDITITGPPNIQDTFLETCDTGEAQTFHFSDALPQINPTNTDVVITFHETETEAHDNQNPLPDTLMASSTTIIYVRAEDSDGCYVVRQLELVIHPLPSFDVQTPVETCYGTTASLSVNSSTGIVHWYDSENSTIPVYTGDSFETPVLSETTSYWVEAINGYGCISERLEVNIIVSTEDIPLFTINQVFCLNAIVNPLPIVSDNGISGSWEPSIVDTSVLGIQTYVFTTDTNECGDVMQISIELEVLDITTPEFNIETEYLLGVTPQPLPGISMNGVSGIWHPSTIINSGTYIFTPYADQCSELFSVEIKVMTYPKFFTPNQDTYNDYWNIYGFSQEHQAKIQIFDRYGKLIILLNASGPGWDGTYNGNNMPTNDYWFEVLYKVPILNGNFVIKEFRSHFTLKR